MAKNKPLPPGATWEVEQNDLPPGVSWEDTSSNIASALSERARAQGGAASDASAAGIRAPRRDDNINPYGWMSPAFTVAGGFLGGPIGAPLGAITGTALDQAINAHMHSRWAPRNAGEASAGIAGNAALGWATEMAPGVLAKPLSAIGRRIAPNLYRNALAVSPELAARFPKIDIPTEAARAGMPRLNQEGVRAAEDALGFQSGRTDKLFEIAQAARRPGGVYSPAASRVPALVPRDVELPLPMSDPQAGAQPTRTVRVNAGLEEVPVVRPRHPQIEAPLREGETPEDFWNFNPSAAPQREFRNRMVERQVPRDVVPNPPQSVIKTVMVPGERTVTGLGRESTMLPGMRASAGDFIGGDVGATTASGERNTSSTFLNKAPRLRKLLGDLGGNLRGAADVNEAKTILLNWLEENKNVADIKTLYQRAKAAGAGGKWTIAPKSSGATAEVAVSPTESKVGEALNQDLVDYIDRNMRSVGVRGFRESLANTQKAIAVKDAVSEASLRRGGQRSIPLSKLEAARGMLPGRGAAQADIARWLAGHSNLPAPGNYNPSTGATDSRFSDAMINMFLRNLPKGAGYTLLNAARMAPWLAQEPNDATQ